jgi:predicted amidophosphoribosyltransferase
MAAGRYSHCPACAASLPEAFGGICPECGLELNSPSAALSVPEAE